MTTAAQSTERHCSKRILSMIPAEPGWRAVLQLDRQRRHHGASGWLPYIYHDGGWHPFSEIDETTVPTEQLGFIAPVIAWTLVEEWVDDIPPGYESRGAPNEDSYEHSRWIEPVYVHGAECHTIEDPRDLVVDLLAPGCTMEDDELRRILLHNWREYWSDAKAAFDDQEVRDAR